MNENLYKLSNEFGTPCLFLSLEEVSRNYNKLQAALPSAKLYYAVKANPHPEIINCLQGLGCHFDVSTNAEVDIIDRGISPEKCIHTHPIKSSGEIQHAVDKGIKLFTIDNESELSKLEPYKETVELCVRISIDNKDCRINLSEKFGSQVSETSDLILKAHKAGFKVTSLSFHTGSQNHNPLKYIDALNHCLDIDEVIKAAGVTIGCIDIGGGFPTEYCETVIDIDEYCRPIRDFIDAKFKDKMIIAEPGRYLVASAMTLVTSIKGKSIRKGQPWYFIDDSIYHSFSGIVFDHCDFPMEHFRNGAKQKSIIAGSTCDSCDIIKKDIEIPELEIGDRLIFRQMGAYCSASASSFNGYSPTQIQVLN